MSQSILFRDLLLSLLWHLNCKYTFTIITPGCFQNNLIPLMSVDVCLYRNQACFGDNVPASGRDLVVLSFLWAHSKVGQILKSFLCQKVIFCWRFFCNQKQLLEMAFFVPDYQHDHFKPIQLPGDDVIKGLTSKLPRSKGKTFLFVLYK